ncbi:hypothetical protein GCM10020218_069640 [Dactylosporangium vinaceum]
MHPPCHPVCPGTHTNGVVVVTRRRESATRVSRPVRVQPPTRGSEGPRGRYASHTCDRRTTPIMSEEYVTLDDKDLNGDGVVDQAKVYTLDDGANVLEADTDGDGEVDLIAIDADGDGVYEETVDPATGESTAVTGS